MTTAIRTGSVMVLWGEMAKTLGPECKALDPRTLAWSGSLLVRIISQTKRGAVAGYYRIIETVDGYQIRPCSIGKHGYECDTGTGYTISLFDPESPRCNCQDAIRTTRRCKHARSCAALKLCQLPKE